MSLHYFSVSLAQNIKTVMASHKFFADYYPDCYFYVICPSNEIDLFKKSLPYKNIEIINEDTIISYSDFFNTYTNYVKHYGITNESDIRMSWYYQQVLKISFFLKKTTEQDTLLLWEADSLPIKKIDFFKNGHPIPYGSLMEFHRPYFSTIETIFGTLPVRYYAFTNNFIAASSHEIRYLIQLLNNYFPNINNLSIGHWVSHIVLKSVLDTHNEFTHSKFSEQELIGLSILLFKDQEQYPIRQVRWGLTGILNKNQITLAKIFGFSYISYEKRHLLNELPQNWKKIIIILIKQRFSQRTFMNSVIPIKMQLKYLKKYFQKKLLRIFF